VSLLHQWERAFALTVVVELAVVVPAFASFGSRGRRVAAGLLGQLATHPAVWFIFPALGLPRVAYLVVAETWAVVIEALVYRFAFPELPWRRAFFVSLLANAASVAAGVLLSW
jgi:hypothetical protein